MNTTLIHRSAKPRVSLEFTPIRKCECCGEHPNMIVNGHHVCGKCLKAGRVPSHLFVNADEATERQPACILLFNRSDGKDYTLTLLER